MHEQYLLPGFEAAPVPTDRLFFAIFPDVDVARRIEQLALHLRREHGLKTKIHAFERFHVSLHHIGDFAGLPRGLLAMAGEAARAAAARSPFEIVFDRAMSFAGRPGHHPFVLREGDDVSALTTFHQALGATMEKAGFKLRKPHFTPHLTLQYGDRCIAEQVIEPVAWTAHEFVLVRSLLDLTHYVPIERWKLLP
jgi:2'-5' RNA ligase